MREVKEGKKEKSAEQESKWGSTEISLTQTHPVLIFVIFLAQWSSVEFGRNSKLSDGFV